MEDLDYEGALDAVVLESHFILQLLPTEKQPNLLLPTLLLLRIHPLHLPHTTSVPNPHRHILLLRHQSQFDLRSPYFHLLRFQINLFLLHRRTVEVTNWVV